MLGSAESGTENVAFLQVTTAGPNNVERGNTRSPKTVPPPDLPQELCKIVDDRGISCRPQADRSCVTFLGKDPQKLT